MEYISRGRDGAQMYSRLEKGEGEWSRFIGPELKRHELYGASSKFCVCREDNWEYMVASCAGHKTGSQLFICLSISLYEK